MADNEVWLPDMAGVEQYVEDYSKPIVPVSGEAEETDWQSRHHAREAERESIRSRVRGSSGSGEYFHKGMPVPTIRDKENRKVGVYARVSTKSTEQTSSIENQQLYYTKKIGDNKHWEMQGIYSDEGKSGMEAKHRSEFQRMIADAGKGKMDLILCASVSRFARDISDCIRYITKLRTMNPRHPVGIFFETENIYTLDPNSEQVLHFHALLAHWESANKSRRMILSYDQRICTGQYPVADLLGYRHTKDGQLIIQPEEAKTVKYVFLSLIVGKSSADIAATLTKKRRPTLKGKKEWDRSMVLRLLTNERRWGDLEARKTIVLDPREKIIVKNNGIRDWAFVPNHHEGIVTPQIARAAQFMASSRGRLPGGIPSLTVLNQGALKGFVSVCPRWRGIDRKTFLSACHSVYQDRELRDLEQKLRIWTGQEENNVLSAAFTGYEVPRGILFLTRSMPSMTITPRSVRFNRACHDRLDNCEWVELLYHPVMQTVAIRKSTAENPNSFQWVRENGTVVNAVATTAFSQAVYEALDWVADYQFRFRGITKERDGAKVTVFSLDEPQILVGKNRKEASGSPTQYIPYTNSAKAGKKEDNCIAYPAEWSRRQGMSCLMRRKREDALSAITKADIMCPGITTENPLIGSIPDREEILRELDELLLSM